MSFTDAPRKLYDYFKAGRQEISFIFSTYTVWNLSGLQLEKSSIGLIMIFILGLMFVGYFMKTVIEPTKTYTSPYAQAVAQNRILMAQGLKKAYPDIQEFQEVIDLMDRWIE